MRDLRYFVAAACLALPCLLAAQPAAFMPVGDVQAGMTGIGRTVFAGDTVADFQVQILGVLRNLVGPKRDLILARLSGGPLVEAGVIAGMSGSPVYINGRLVGAVSYALGSFAKEPIAGITPIAEMTSDADTPAPRPREAMQGPEWPATPAAVFNAIKAIADRASAPLMLPSDALPMSAMAALSGNTLALRPIAAAMIMRGWDPAVPLPFGSAADLPPQHGAAAPSDGVSASLHPGDAVGISLIRGDFEMAATGTVTYVAGSRVYAFGHPFLDLGPTSMVMTRAHVYTVLPSLESSMKIADLGPVVGTLTQDRQSAIGGTLGPPPQELRVSLSLASAGVPDRRFAFSVLQDPSLTPLFTYVAVLNALSAYARQSGPLTVGVTGTATFGAQGTIQIDDLFTGESALTGPASVAATPIAAMIGNEWHAAMPDTLDLEINATEEELDETIERAWLDTTKPHPGGSYTLHVMLRKYRGDTDVLSFPVTMPAQAAGALSLLVCDAPTLTALEQHELKPGTPRTLDQLVRDLNGTRRNNRLYVRLLATDAGTTVGGETLPSLPASVRDVLNADKSTTTTAVSRSVVGAWEQRLGAVVHGSRELPITLVSGR